MAANHYLISEANQISPKILKKLKGKTGATGKHGTPGPAGTPGAPGAPGPPARRGRAAKKGRPDRPAARSPSRTFSALARPPALWTRQTRRTSRPRLSRSPAGIASAPPFDQERGGHPGLLKRRDAGHDRQRRLHRAGNGRSGGVPGWHARAARDGHGRHSRESRLLGLLQLSDPADVQALIKVSSVRRKAADDAPPSSPQGNKRRAMLGERWMPPGSP